MNTMNFSTNKNLKVYDTLVFESTNGTKVFMASDNHYIIEGSETREQLLGRVRDDINDVLNGMLNNAKITPEALEQAKLMINMRNLLRETKLCDKDGVCESN